MTELRDGYDRVAADYAAEFACELEKKPFDRKMLDWLAEKVAGLGAICDMGCGPGQVARYLHDRGVEACGVDLSAEMVRHARRLNPAIHFEQGDMLSLADIADETYGGVAAFYSVIHVPRPRVVDALSELRRVLRRRGALLVTFHIGRETVHRDEFFGQRGSMDLHFFESAEMKAHLTAAGFDLEEAVERDPYPPAVEYQSRRAYIFARKP